jgi:hypothetical protein
MKSDLINFRVSAIEKTRYEQAAVDAGLSLTGWIKEQLATALLTPVKAEEASQVAPGPMISAPRDADHSQLLCCRCFRWVCQHCGACRRLLKCENN